MALIKTKKDNSPITLSVTIKYGHYGTTTINLNGNPIKTIGGNFKDFVLGTNNSLKHNTISVVTSVLVTNAELNTEVEFDVVGGENSDKDTSNIKADNNVNYVPHYNGYTFI
ncbi:MAG: hypothetical protein JNJ41_12985 [Bacteroidia bacterium]|nr:hypothetical protein [Bacteroidia bacterium]